MSKHTSLSEEAIFFQNINDKKNSVITREFRSEYDPIFVIWGDDTKWTVLGGVAICSVHCGTKNFMMLDDIKQRISAVLAKNNGSMNNKKNVDFLKIGDEDHSVSIWTKNGQLTYALMNILRMFPISRPQEEGIIT